MEMRNQRVRSFTGGNAPVAMLAAVLVLLVAALVVRGFSLRLPNVGPASGAGLSQPGPGLAAKTNSSASPVLEERGPASEASVRSEDPGQMDNAFEYLAPKYALDPGYVRGAFILPALLGVVVVAGLVLSLQSAAR